MCGAGEISLVQQKQKSHHIALYTPPPRIYTYIHTQRKKLPTVVQTVTLIPLFAKSKPTING